MTQNAPLDVVVIDLDDRRYGIAADHVERVVAMVAVTALRGSPAVVAGVIDVGGDIVPVIDLRVCLGHATRPARPADHLVLAWAAHRSVALWVDRAAQLISVPAVQPGSAGLSDQRHIVGFGKTPDGLLVITDLDAFLSAADEVALDSALAAAQ